MQDTTGTNREERAEVTRFMSVPLVGHALHVRATGAAASCAAGPVCVGPNPIWPGGASKAAGVPPFLAAAQRRRLGEGGKAMRRLTDFDPPGC
jgi:hypothetical protein